MDHTKEIFDKIEIIQKSVTRLETSNEYTETELKKVNTGIQSLNDKLFGNGLGKQINANKENISTNNLDVVWVKKLAGWGISILSVILTGTIVLLLRHHLFN